MNEERKDYGKGRRGGRRGLGRGEESRREESKEKKRREYWEEEEEESIR